MMDKQREEFNFWFGISKYTQVILPTDSNRQIAWDSWQAAQAAMQPEIAEWKNKWASEKGASHNLIAAKKVRDMALEELSAANQRNKELQSENEDCRNLMRIKQEQNDAFNQRIQELLDLVEVIERRNKQLEDRIRVADAEEPVLLVVVEENDGGTLSHRISWSEANQLPLGYWPMFVHAQIPAEVDFASPVGNPLRID